ncbi:MAG: NAD(P)/FAD-dependent oxidoreductase [Cyclobacteriaceae bacterium]|nr:NAD(P)/FAD-dependent oxidoreductase [Cyclobacteriaceae bacterium]MDH4294882.1 NAD(P)/FAD-dependent oxidoreductase [Cyclobacteriaceae bacterium]MDH5248772.1 NAD(P)/FAD-dependent oxidoreductase [Cyclobacteriaceae bacterium]
MKNQDETKTESTFYETIIIGGGQAGLSVGYGLAKAGRQFTILDANERIGDAWRNRWDSLKLFTPTYLNGLAGMPFPGKQHVFISKDEMADYLETYAKKFKLPVRTGLTVDRLSRQDNHFLVSADGKFFKAKNVVVAMANYQNAKVPAFAKDIDSSIVQLHSKEYKNPSQLNEGSVLVVGAGTSGADIALEVSKTHHTWISGKEVGHVPFRIETSIARYLLIRMVRFVGHHLLNTGTPFGRKLRPKALTSAGPLVRVKPKDLTDAGIERVPKVIGVQNGLPLLENNKTLPVKNIIWCTGYSPGFSWVDMPVLGEGEEPFHSRGVVNREPGLYFVGLNFLYSMTSDTVTGIKRDAAHIVRKIIKS